MIEIVMIINCVVIFIALLLGAAFKWAELWRSWKSDRDKSPGNTH